MVDTVYLDKASAPAGTDVTITGGAAIGSANAPNVNVIGGNSTSGVSGNVNITAGNATAGSAGSVTLAGGASDTEDAQGAVNIFTTSGNGTAGIIQIVTGSATGGIGDGGNMFLQTGDGAVGAAAHGGNISLQGGQGRTTGKGGSFNLTTGDGGATGSGGDITLAFGVGNSPGRNGLFFPGLPTSDPGVPGAAWADPVTHIVKISA